MLQLEFYNFMLLCLSVLIAKIKNNYVYKMHKLI